MKHLLIIVHRPSENTCALAQALWRGATHSDIEAVEVRMLDPLDAGADDVLWCDAIILGTTENFGYMAGRIKDFFERIYYPCLEKTQGLPYAIYIRAGMDGTGTRISMEKIITGLRWRAVQEPLILQGDFDETPFVESCHELGMTLAASLEAGIL